MASNSSKITVGQVLFPVSMTAFVLFTMLAFQTSQIMREHDALREAKTGQNKPLEEAQKLQTQLSALALGTKKLADGGNKDAQAIIDRMKQLGIVVNPPGAKAVPAAATPASAPASGSAPENPKATAPAAMPADEPADDSKD